MWILIFVGICLGLFDLKLFHLKYIIAIALIILAGRLFNMRPQAFITILAIFFTGLSLAKQNDEMDNQIHQFHISNNAILFFDAPSMLLTDKLKKINIPIKNIGNTLASDFKLGVVLLGTSNDPASEKVKIVLERLSPQIINPGIELYPKEEQSISINLPKGDFKPSRFYFLLCYLEYKTFTGEPMNCERWFQYEKGEWLLLGKDQESISKFKAGLEEESQILKENIRNK
jgi:hypothetical protein